MKQLSPRNQEIQILNEVNKSARAEFLAVYGRRRVGKTFLIRNYFNQKSHFVEVTGLQKGSMAEQLKVFSHSFNKYFNDGYPIKTPNSWSEAFKLITQKLDNFSSKKKITIFFDELPWLATPRSKLLTIIEHYWNTDWQYRANLTFVVCGSAASWIIKKIVNSKGGLHNRITRFIHLQPFTLNQTQEFLRNKNIKLSLKNTLDIYMVTGGIPYYLEYIKKSYSVAQNINSICFGINAPLQNEYEKLIKSLFKQHKDCSMLLKVIASKRYGINRKGIIKLTGIQSGGNLNDRLEELESAGFIKSYTPFGFKSKEKIYRMIDEYCLFYYRWIEANASSGFEFPDNYWQKIINTPSWQAWAGYSFETLCLKHYKQILKALGLESIHALPATWRHIPPKGRHEQGAQIDLLFDRDDNAITVCEMKYSANQYVLDKASAKNIMNKVNTFESVTNTRKKILVALVTTVGVKPSLWAEDVIDNVVTIEDLFTN